MLPITGNFLFDAFHRAGAPVDTLRDHAADYAAGPDQFIGREQPPCFIALNDPARDELAGDRGVTQPLTSKPARQPEAGLDLADLRHAMDSAAECSAPKMCNANGPKDRKGSPDVIRKRALDQAWGRLPSAHASRPLQTVAADDAIVIVGAICIAYRPSIAHHIVQHFAHGLGDHHESRDRQQCRRQLRHEGAEMDVAGEHDVRGTYAAGGSDDALADSGRVERNRRRVLIYSHPRVLGQSREAEGIVVWVYVEGLTVVNGAKISRTAQLLAYPFCRPKFDVRTNPAHALNFGTLLGGIVGCRHMQPPIDEINAGHPRVEDRAPDILETLFGQVPKLFGVIETDAFDNVAHIFRKSRKHKTQAASRGCPRDRRRLEHSDRPAPLSDLTGDGETGEPGADHAHIDVEIDAQARTVRTRNAVRFVPSRFHVFASAPELYWWLILRRSAAREGVLVSFATDLHSMTMRRLLLFRHAKAERSHAGTEDRSRKLIDRGRADAAKVGSYMASHALIPDQVLTSPSARTRETWKFAGAAFRPPLAAAQVESLYAASAHAIFGVVKGTGPAIHTLLVVGHNPGLHELAVMLIASGDVEERERLKEKLPTSGFVIIDFAFDDWSRLHPQCGRLERFVTPKSLASAAN